MPLNIGASGSIKPYAKYNSKADKWFARGDEGDIEIGRPTFVADFANIRDRLAALPRGPGAGAGDRSILGASRSQPGRGLQARLRLMVFSQKFFGGAVELASASIHMGNAIRELYQAYEEQRGSHPGQLPVIACVGSEPMKDKYGTNYKPKLEIVKWVDRPAELPDESPVDAADVWQGAPASTARPQATHVPPPRTQTRRRRPHANGVLT